MYAKRSFYLGKVQESASRRHPPPLIDEYAEELAISLCEGCRTDETAAMLRTLVRHRSELCPTVHLLLIEQLHALAGRVTEFAHQLSNELDDFATLKAVEHRLSRLTPPEGQVDRLLVKQKEFT